MQLPKILQDKLTIIFNNRDSIKMKEYRAEQLVLYEEDESLQHEMRAFWKQLKTTKTNDIQWDHPSLIKDTKGNIKENNVANLFTILTQHSKFTGRLSYNEFSRLYHYDGKEIVDQDYDKLRLDLCIELNLNFKIDDVRRYAELVAKINTFHPVRDYLRGLSWDGVDRMRELCRILAVECNELNVEVLNKWLVGMVKRVMEPGCKMDQVVVFQGATGNRKSTALKVLAVKDEWFCDEPIDFTSKDSKQMLLSKWIVELAELSSLNKKDNNTIKQNITQTVDEFRSPYDRKPRKYPRQFVYVGTTNDLEFMTDPTSNRRFWILANEGAIDIDQLVLIRDQLWAQAYALWQKGTPCYLDREKEQAMAQRASQYELKDAWHDKVVAFLEDKNFATTAEILDFLVPSISNQQNTDRSRVVKIMQFLKWNNGTTRLPGQKTTISGWKRPLELGKVNPIVGEPIADWN